jgi:exopolysaccharide production protein ExoQ
VSAWDRSGRAPGNRSARRRIELVAEFAATPRFNRALTITILLFAFATHSVRALVGQPGALAILIALDLLAALSLYGQRTRIEWRGLLPISLLSFFSWMALSVVWSDYQWSTVGGTAYALAFALLGAYLALGRDLIQVVRGAGDALRILLVASLVLEVVSGLLLDTPIRFLAIAGNLASGGPIQGIAGNRNYLGFLALLGAITFLVEHLTRSISRNLAVASIATALGTIALTRSPVTMAAALVVGLALLALVALRRSSGEVRRWTQVGLLGALMLLATVAWAFREPLTRTLNAASEIEYRTGLWARMNERVGDATVEGLGWVGPWPVRVEPFRTLGLEAGRVQATGLSAISDTVMQLGLVGLLILLAVSGLAFWRSWVLASTHKTKAHVWPALVLVLLGATSFGESYLLAEGGLLLLVTIATSAAHRLSWRHRLPPSATESPR